MRKLAEKIVDAIDSADNSTLDEIEATEETLKKELIESWKESGLLDNVSSKMSDDELLKIFGNSNKN
jgi:hypothetical protein